MKQTFGEILIALHALLAVCMVGCKADSVGETIHVDRRPAFHIDHLLAVFEHSGKDREELVRIGRAIIEKFGQPPANEQSFWQVEVARSDLTPLLDYLAGVWNVRAVVVGGYAESRYIVILIADPPVQVWVHDKDSVPLNHKSESEYITSEAWGPAIMFCCVADPPKDEPHMEQRTPYFKDEFIAVFERSGKVREELVRIGRALIRKVGQRPDNAQNSWQVEIDRSDLVPLLDYLAGVWKIRAVMVGGDTVTRHIEIHIADQPVGIWLYEKDIVKPVDSRNSGYEAIEPWGTAIVFAASERRYWMAGQTNFVSEGVGAGP